MKKIILLIFVFFISNLNYIQAQKIKWGSEIKEINGNMNALIETSTGVFSFYAATFNLFSYEPIQVHRYSSDLVFEKAATIELDKKFVLESVVKLGDEIYLIYNNYEKSEEQTYCAFRVDQKYLKINKDEMILLDKLDNRQKFLSKDFASFLNCRSQNKLKFGVVGLPAQKKEEDQILSLSVFDNELEKLWERKVAVAYEEKLFFAQDYDIDNQGRMYVLSKVYDKKLREKKDGESNYKYVMLIYSNATDKPESYEIVLDGLFVSELNFILDEKGNILCTGLYSKEYREDLNGIFFVKIDLVQKKIVTQKTKPFSSEVVEKLEGEKATKKGKGISNNFKLNRLIRRDDGGVVALAEKSYERITTTNNLNRPNYWYYVNEILVININPNGEIAWVSVVEKKQSSYNDEAYYLSYSAAVIADKLYLLFNVNEKQYTKEKELSLNNIRNSVVVLQKVNGNGQMSNELLFKNNEDDVETIAVPKRTYQVSDNEILIFTSKRQKQRLARISFTE